MDDWEKLTDAMVYVARHSTIPQPKTEQATAFEQRIRNCVYDLIYRADVVHFLLSSAEGLHDTPAWASLLDDCAKSIESKENFHTVDAVPVIRCRDCIHGRFKHQDMYECLHDADIDENTGVAYGFIDYHEPDFFCAYGERKTENEDPKAD